MKRVNEARITALFVMALAMSLGVVGCGDDTGGTTDPIGGDESGSGGGGGTSTRAGSGGAGSGGRSGGGGESGSAGATSEGGAGAAAPGAGRGAAGTAGGAGAAGAAGSQAGRGGAAAGSGGSEAGSGGMDDDAGVDEEEPQAGSGGVGGSGGSGGDEAEAGRGGAGGSGGAGGDEGEAGSGGDEGDAGSGGSGDGPRCGTRGGVTCPDDEFCNFEPDEDCGGTDRGGVCEDRPEVCTAIYDPVCGCDNRTYASACVAHGAGVSVKHDGQCNRDECIAAGGRVVLSDGASTPSCEPAAEGWNIESGGDEGAVCCLGDGGEEPAGDTCGGIASLECAGGEFCNYEVEAGGQGCDGSVADAAGVCEERPRSCTRQYAPVCGCDRKSYGNACAAHSMGVAVLHNGACTESDCEFVGGRVDFGIGFGPMCDPGEVEFTYVVGDSGAIPIEGALCCVEE